EESLNVASAEATRPAAALTTDAAHTQLCDLCEKTPSADDASAVGNPCQCQNHSTPRTACESDSSLLYTKARRPGPGRRARVAASSGRFSTSSGRRRSV